MISPAIDCGDNFEDRGDYSRARLAAETCNCLTEVQKQSILVIEDDFDIGRLIKEYIGQAQLYDVMVTQTADEAKKLFQPGKYFAILLDLHLGQSIEEGIELAVYFRDQDDNVFIAVVSGYYPVFDERLLQCVDDFLKKPIDYDFLLSKLLMWQIKHSRRLALKNYVEEKVLSYKKCLSEIREEEELLKEQLSDLLDSAGFTAEGGVRDK